MKILSLTIATAIIISAGVFANYWANQPSDSVINSSPNAVTAEPKPDTVISTPYFNVKIPSAYEVKSQTENATKQDLTQIVLMQPKASSRQIALNLSAVAALGSLDDVASYNLRYKNPQKYIKTEFAGMPEGVPTFYSENSGLYEITGFWVKGGLCASIAVSGVIGEMRQINDDYVSLLNSWQWQ